MKPHQFTTMRVWADTRRALRLVAAITDETLVEALHRLVTVELRHLQSRATSEASATED